MGLGHYQVVSHVFIRYGQGAVVQVVRVVIGHFAIQPGEGEPVFTGAHQRLAAGEGVLSAFAFHEAGAFHRVHRVFGQGHTVIGLGCVLRQEAQDARRDGQFCPASHVALVVAFTGYPHFNVNGFTDVPCRDQGRIGDPLVGGADTILDLQLVAVHIRCFGSSGGVQGAVVGLGHVMGGQGHVVGDVALGNVQVAGHVGQGVVGGNIVIFAIHNGSAGRHQLILVVAYVGLLAVDVHRYGLTLHHIAGGEAILAVRLSVIHHGVVAGGDGGCPRRDGQLADVEVNMLVLILMLEHDGIDDVIAAICHVGHPGVQGEGNLIIRNRDRVGLAGGSFLTDVVVHDQVAVIAVRLSVVGPGAAADGDVDCMGILGDLQSAVHVGDGIVLGDIIAGGIHDEGIGRHVVYLAHVGDFTGDGDTLQALVSCQVGVGFAVLGQGLAIVLPLVAASRNGHSLGVNGQAAVFRYNELHVEVGVVVDEVICGQTHGVVACIRALGHGQIHGGEVCCGVQVVRDADHGVAHGGAGVAVIGLGVGNALDRHHHRVGGDDLQGAGLIGDLVVGGDIIAFRIHDDSLLRHQLVLVLAYRCGGKVDVHGVNPMTLCQIGGGEGVGLVLAVFLSIVDDAQVIVGLDDDLRIPCATLGHLQGAQECGHGIVGCQGILIEFIGEGVLALACVSLAAGVGHVDAFALDEAIAGDVVAFLLQGRAVIFLFGRAAGQGD